MSAFNIDKKLGPMRIRAWFLVLNFAFNAIALFGLSRVMVAGTGWPILIVGALGTLACIALLSTPAED